MDKNRVVLRGAVVGLALLVLSVGSTLVLQPGRAQVTEDASMPVEFGRGRVEIVSSDGKTHAFQVETALTPQQERRGLMFRKSLADDAGMIFLQTPPDDTAFWMHNTPISLDIVFIAPGGTILRIERSATPMSDRNIPSGGVVSAVLELRGGLTQELGIDKGDRVSWELQGR